MRILLLAAAIVLATVYAIASDVTLAWDASADPSVVGYNVYTGSQSRAYTNSVNAGAATSVTISNLVPGVTYYFAATCYTLSGLESDFSAEAIYTVPTPTPGAPDPPAGFIYLGQ